MLNEVIFLKHVQLYVRTSSMQIQIGSKLSFEFFMVSRGKEIKCQSACKPGSVEISELKEPRHSG